VILAQEPSFLARIKLSLFWRLVIGFLVVIKLEFIDASPIMLFICGALMFCCPKVNIWPVDKSAMLLNGGYAFVGIVGNKTSSKR